MSRIGKKPIPIPKDIKVDIGTDEVRVSRGGQMLSERIHPGIRVRIEEDQVVVERDNDLRESRALHGLTRSLINNMVIGVTEGFSKKLEINGVGYRAAKQGKNLNLSLGFSHPVIVEPPAGIAFDTPSATEIIISGIDKEAVGAMAAKIRSYREPEPYKGKGIKYEGEHIRRKVGKAGAKGKK